MEDLEAALGKRQLQNAQFSILKEIKAKDHHLRNEKRVWFLTLLGGTTGLYAARTTFPLVAPEVAEDLKWSKTDVGTVLSAFFWGYTLTQILGGYLSDRFGAERVLLAAGAGWGIITFWFHEIVFISKDHELALSIIILSRVLLGACQGVHFPSLASITSQRLNSRDRSVFFSALTSGSSLGTLLTGTIGSYANETLGWPSVFYLIGLISLLWVACLNYVTGMRRSKGEVVGVTDSVSLLGGNLGQSNDVPWLVYLKHPALWACITCHFCQNNCFYILLSWLPTYFHDNFPSAKGWVFNVVPWVVVVPGIALGNFVSRRLMAKNCGVGPVRKIVQSICMCMEGLCLLLLGHTQSYIPALCLMSLCLFFSGFHNASLVVNPQDLAPKHAGSVFGMMNAVGSIPGFVGVYITGYILDVTKSWSVVFQLTAILNAFGVFIFCVFGSGRPITQ